MNEAELAYKLGIATGRVIKLRQQVEDLDDYTVTELEGIERLLIECGEYFAPRRIHLPPMFDYPNHKKTVL